MKAHWLNIKNSKKIIVFFAGWSFDYFPFESISTTDYDVLFVYDYNEMSVPKEFNEFEKYEEKTLISWSMGVFTAYMLKDIFKNFDYKIAVNGTVTPVDDRYGIPVRAFELTVRFAQKALGGKFYENIFLTSDEYNLYLKNPVKREIDDRVSELNILYKLIKNNSFKYEKFYDKAIVSEFDKIIPPDNQKSSHLKNDVPVITLPFGHFPYYNFLGWDEIIKCR